MARIELSLTAVDSGDKSAYEPWITSVTGSSDMCLLLDETGAIVASSAACRAALGLAEDVDGVGLPLLSSTMQLLSFSASGGDLPSWDAERVPPLQALKTDALARGLLRVSVGDVARTYDAIAAPLHGDSGLTGSLTFFRRC